MIYSPNFYLNMGKNLNVLGGIAVLVLILTNLITGWAVYASKEKEYNKLKDSIQTTIQQKVELGNQLDALMLACPDAVIEE